MRKRASKTTICIIFHANLNVSKRSTGGALDHEVREKSRCHREEPLVIDSSVGREGLLSSIRHPQRGSSRRLVSHCHSHRRCLPTYGGNHGITRILPGTTCLASSQFLPWWSCLSSRSDVVPHASVRTCLLRSKRQNRSTDACENLHQLFSDFSPREPSQRSKRL